jgi:hypothetical protein
MHPRKFAQIGGFILLTVGVIALIPALVGTTDNLPDLKLDASYGLFLGIFPMNILTKLAMIIFGLAGIGAANAEYTSLPMSIWWSRIVFFVMGALAILGLFSSTNTLGGYWPLFGSEVAVHAVFAVLGAYFGYALTAQVPDSGPAVRDFRTRMGTR